MKRILNTQKIKTMRHLLLLITASLFALLICREGNAQYDNLHEYLDRMTEQKKFTGTVMIATDDKILFEKATGPATADGTLMNEANSVYRIGSITKSFTSVLALKSAEAGKLSLDDKLSTWHPEVTNAEKVTVRQLLSHTSGIASYTELPDMTEWKYDEHSVADMIIRFRGLKSEFEPGTKHKYSNSNYFLLGSILEKIYDKPYAQIVKEMITEPLGMRQTGIDPEANRVELSKGLSPRINGWDAVPPVHPSVPYAAGALYSSVNDLHTFSAALFTNHIFEKEATLIEMQTPVMGNYGFGLFESEVAGEKAVAHNGGIDGYSSTWLYFPERKLHIISLSNSLISDHASVTDAALRVHRGEKVEIPLTRQARILPAKLLNRYTGSYALDAGFLLDIAAGGGGLSCQVPGQERVELQAAEDTLFFSDIHNLEISFHMAEDGKSVRELTLRQGGISFKGQPFNLPDQIFKVDSKTLRKLTGIYELQPGFDLTITVNDGVLMGQATGQGAFELIAENETRFFATVAPIDIEFETDKNGFAKAITLKQAGQVLYAERKKEQPEDEK